MKKILKTGNLPTILIRLTIGLTFLSEGVQKFLFPDITGTGRFAKIGFTNPSLWAYFTGSFEITCGLLAVFGFLTRLASIPLLIIMITAFITTKLPIFINQGFWALAHEYRTDFAMTMLLFFLLYYGGGRFSIDDKFFTDNELFTKVKK
jgi:uncharacterized membrane protein YphA (DoxX/SURF4 family)